MLFFVVIYCIKSPKHYVEVWDCEVQLVFCKVLYTVPMCYVSNYHFSVIYWISWTNTGLKREHPGDTHPEAHTEAVTVTQAWLPTHSRLHTHSLPSCHTSCVWAVPNKHQMAFLFLDGVACQRCWGGGQRLGMGVEAGPLEAPTQPRGLPVCASPQVPLLACQVTFTGVGWSERKLFFFCLNASICWS